jgi:hypothetical protein
MDYTFLKRQDYVFSFVRENLEMVLYSLIAFTSPLMIGHPQLIVGILVNAALVLAALNLTDFRLLPIILLPSIGVLTRGVIFGPFTIFLIYMIPFVWIGNAILVFTMKKLIYKNKFISLLLGSLIKTLFLFFCAFILVNLGVIPIIFLTTMGIFQFYTAISGGIIALGIQKVKKLV